MIYGNKFLPEEYLVEYTGANKEYRAIIKELNKNYIKFYFKDYPKAFFRKDKDECLKLIKGMEDVCKKCRKLADAITPDQDDTAISEIMSGVKMLLTYISYGLLGKGAEFPRIVVDVQRIIGLIAELKTIKPHDNPGDRNKKYNTFRNAFLDTIKSYEYYLDKQKDKVNEW